MDNDDIDCKYSIISLTKDFVKGCYYYTITIKL